MPDWIAAITDKVAKMPESVFAIQDCISAILEMVARMPDLVAAITDEIVCFDQTPRVLKTLGVLFLKLTVQLPLGNGHIPRHAPLWQGFPECRLPTRDKLPER